jgi:hypothetical protein
MKRFKHFFVLGLVAAFAGMLLTACSTGNADYYGTSTKSGRRVQEKNVRFKGTVEYDRGGEYPGRYLIVSDNGRRYYPLNLSRRYRHDDMRVQVYGVTRGYAEGGSAWALEIFDIAGW